METLFLCVEVFLARILDVSIGSVRTIFLVKEKNIIATFLAFLEILIWFFVARETLTAENTNIFVVLCYAGGYATGTYVGGLINKYFIKGNLTMIAITSSKNMVNALKRANYGVSSISLDGNKQLLLIELKKQKLSKLKSIIKGIDPNAFLIVNESLSVENGFIN